MRLTSLDLSKYTDEVASQYKRLSKTQLRLLSSQVPESFLERFQDRETALKELLDVIYGTDDLEIDGDP
jgi:hypothetical protein